MIKVGDWITVRRRWSRTSTGPITSGSAYFVIAVGDETETFLYLQGDGTLGTTEYQFPMTEDSDEWFGKYRITHHITNVQLHEIATHSQVGPSSKNYILDCPQPSARF